MMMKKNQKRLTTSICVVVGFTLVMAPGVVAQEDEGEPAQPQPMSAASSAHAKAAVLSNTLTDAEHAAGWTLLFDGESTEHWRGYKKDGFPEQGWVVENGTLKVTAGGGGGDIITTEQYGDFEFSCEFKVSPRANSGIMYRVSEQHAASWQSGAEYQILDDAAFGVEPTASTSVGGCYDLIDPSEKELKPVGEFNTARIRIQDHRVTHYLNGKKILEYRMDSEDWKNRIANSKFAGYEGFGVQARGHIALQDHGNDVWFRNLKIRDLSNPMPGQVKLFNGKDLSGWSAFLLDDGQMEETWSVEDGILVCIGKPAGYIKTDDSYDNYVLKLEWRWDPVTLRSGNSGVLMRLQGKDKVWPKSVEAQLMGGNAGDFWNIGGFQMQTDPERTKGRNTRKLRMAERPIGEWNEYEIIVDHNEITLYVNGEMLNYAWDVAELAGPIALQSEGAPIHFRRIRLAPID